MAITSFFFDRAKYRLGDTAGNVVLLVVDYHHAKFELQERARVNVQLMRELRQKARTIARDLIARKHDVNFSAKINVQLFKSKLERK